MNPEYNIAALEAIQGDFSILLDLSRLTLLTKNQKDHHDETITKIETLSGSLNSLFDQPTIESSVYIP